MASVASAPSPSALSSAPAHSSSTPAGASETEPTLIAGRLFSPEVLEEWRRWLQSNQRDAEQITERVLPQALRLVLDSPPVAPLPEKPTWVNNLMARPESPEQILEYFALQGFLPAQPHVYEKARTEIVHRFALDDAQTVGAVDDICALARTFFAEDVSVVSTSVTDTLTFLTGLSRAKSDAVDWAKALETLPPEWCLCRHGILAEPGRPLVILDTAKDWRVRKNPLFNEHGGHLRFYASVTISLPSFVQVGHSSSDAPNLVPVGNLCAISKNPQAEVTETQVKALMMLAKRIERDLLIGYEERQKAKKREQAAFISSFLQLTLGGSAMPDVSKVSPGMEAVTSAAGKRHTAAFSLAAERIVALSSAQSCAILDFRAFLPAKNSRAGPSVDADMRRRAKRPRIFYSAQNSSGLNYEYEGGNPLEVLGDHGVPEEAREKLKKLGVAEVAELEQLVERIKQGEKDQASVYRTVLSHLATTPHSTILPVFDHNSSLALLIFLSLDDASPDNGDIEFIQNVGRVCLSALVKDADVENDRSRLAFISTIAHALRTPVHSLSCQLELLRGTSVELDEQLRVADVCIDSLRGIMDDAVDFWHLGDHLAASTTTSTAEVVDLAALLHDVTASALNRTLQVDYEADVAKLGQKKVEVVLEISARQEGWLARVSTGDLRRIVGNLVANAYSYSETGTVRVSLLPIETINDQQMVSIEVSDEGRGMDDAFLTSGQLFVPFKRGEAYKSGAGLGLPIVASLVAQYDGRIGVKSALGKGTSVSVLLPLPLVPSRPVAAFRRTLSDELNTVHRALSSVAPQFAPNSPQLPSPTTTPSQSLPPSRSASRAPSPATTSPTSDDLSGCPPPAKRPRGRPLRVLACEDNALSRKLLAALIVKNGWDFLGAVDGERGVEIFREGVFKPDVTVMDIGMPRKDGIQASHEIREIEAERGLPRHRIIALTALSNEQDQQKALGENGPIDDWLLKGGTSLKVLTDQLARLQLDLDDDASPADEPKSPGHPGGGLP